MNIILILYTVFVNQSGDVLNITTYYDNKYQNIEQCIQDGNKALDNLYSIYDAGDTEYAPNGFKCEVVNNVHY